MLVCGAEALSRITDNDDRGTAVLFGDGAGAVVVAAGELDLGCGGFVLGCDPEQGDLLYADTTSASCAWRAARSTATPSRAWSRRRARRSSAPA